MQLCTVSWPLVGTPAATCRWGEERGEDTSPVRMPRSLAAVRGEGAGTGCPPALPRFGSKGSPVRFPLPLPALTLRLTEALGLSQRVTCSSTLCLRSILPLNGSPNTRPGRAGESPRDHGAGALGSGAFRPYPLPFVGEAARRLAAVGDAYLDTELGALFGTSLLAAGSGLRYLRRGAASRWLPLSHGAVTRFGLAQVGGWTGRGVGWGLEPMEGGAAWVRRLVMDCGTDDLEGLPVTRAATLRPVCCTPLLGLFPFWGLSFRVQGAPGELDLDRGAVARREMREEAASPNSPVVRRPERV
eukprot:Hpha_TRINITY_DN15034_c0_g6::TRINITY_DN15034_c0_g6_i1::g.126173::m.126173